jgi:transcriptional regulator with GAF, ATPase, and Fis domain
MKRRSRQTREQSRELALAFLGAVVGDEVRLRSVVSAHIERVLEASDHNLSLAAELLGMNRRSLQRYARRKADGHKTRARRKTKSKAKSKAKSKKKR